MNVTGIIMECNPFHEGHAYLLQEARRQTDADYIVVAMSGDFVQRGEPAVFDKYVRAEQILRAGADLVLELPVYAACGSAEYFALGGLSLLEKLGVVTSLCFGSESADTGHLIRCAQILSLLENDQDNDDRADNIKKDISPVFDRSDPAVSAAAYRETLQRGLKAGLPFPAARAAAIPSYPSAPNDLLAVEYCRALLGLNSGISPLALARIEVPSASERRKKLLCERMSGSRHPADPCACPPSPDGITPRHDVFSLGPDVFPLGPDDFSGELLYALRMQADQLEEFADVSPDLADRIRNLLPRYRSFSQFCDLVKTRNLTRTRVSRCLTHILLQMKQSGLDALRSKDMALYARPLALNRSAAPLFSSIRRNASIPFLPKLSEAAALLPPGDFHFLQEEIRAEDLYSLTLAGVMHAARYQSDWNASAGGSSPSPVPSALSRRIFVLGR